MPSTNKSENCQMPLKNIKNINNLSPPRKHKNPKDNSKNIGEKKPQKLNQNISQSQEAKMEIEDMIQGDLIGSLSTRASNNICSSLDSNANLKNLNCANSNNLNTGTKNIFFYQEQNNKKKKRNTKRKRNI